MLIVDAAETEDTATKSKYFANLQNCFINSCLI